MISRRHFLQASLSVALVPALPRFAWAATALKVRPSWSAFCAGPLYTAFLAAIGTMRANKDSTDPNSWLYWANVHHDFCPHGLPYFLAWHRGFIARFESRLRMISGNPDMVLPYWDYYTDPSVPAEFMDDTTSLWRGDRTGDNVSAALTLDPFADTIIHFPRGATDAFEPSVETAPHNPVHNLIGGRMSSVTYSPLDPLFWVHHANIDRLWAAWIAAGNGRRMPATTNSYWTGSFSYGPAIRSMPRVWTHSTSDYLGYQYDNETMPSTLPSTEPPPPSTSTATAASMTMAGAGPTRPPSTQTMAMGTGKPLSLDQNSISIDVLLTDQQRSQLRSLLLQPSTASTAGNADSSIRIVLDDVHLTALGEKGGYFYKVYINLPEQGATAGAANRYLVGMLGAFEVGAARMRMQMKGSSNAMSMPSHGSAASAAGAPLQMVFPATKALRAAWPENLDKLTVSFVRADGGKPAHGTVIKVKEFRVETAASPAK